MPRISMKADNINQLNQNFTQTPIKTPLFLNSVPKCGSHLLRNIMRMMAPVRQHHADQFIQFANLMDNRAAFNLADPRLSWGHLLFSDVPAVLLRGTKKILLYRDPYTWVPARARFFLSDEYDNNLNHLKDGKIDLEEFLTVMILGSPGQVKSLHDTFKLNAVAWMSSADLIVKYEELVAHVKALDEPAAEAYFINLFEKCGIDPIPDDWRERVRIGSDRKHSGTARENLSGISMEIPKELPDIHKKQVDFTSPGLRAILGYE